MPTTDINIINVNGLDYPIKDQEARNIAESAMGIFAYKEDGYTASQDYPVIGTPICWKGELYYTTIAITEGALFVVGTNLRSGEKAGIVYASSIATLEDELTANDHRIYMDYKDGKYGYNTSPTRGADTFTPFKRSSVMRVATGLSGTTSRNISSIYPDYASLTASNFIVEFTGGSAHVGAGNYYSDIDGYESISKSYNASTGVITCTYTASRVTMGLSYNLWIAVSE